MRKRDRRFGSFTLIGLLVVIAIIATAAAILFPVFARVRENARRTDCLSNLKQIGLAAMQYVQDYDETYPPLYYAVPSGTPMSDGQVWIGSASAPYLAWSNYCIRITEAVRFSGARLRASAKGQAARRCPPMGNTARTN